MPPPKRTYSSPRRDAQARSTRAAILDAAQELFGTDGYAGTTIAAIAAGADVGQATVYAGFGSKQGVLEAVIDRSIVGDDEPVALDERPETQAVLADPDGSRRIATIAAGTAEMLGRMRSVADIVTAVEPLLGTLKQTYDERRLASVRMHIASMSDAGLLRDDLDRTEAGDITWALISWELYLMLVRDRGWTAEQYDGWLRRMLSAALLPAAADPRDGPPGEPFGSPAGA